MLTPTVGGDKYTISIQYRQRPLRRMPLTPSRYSGHIEQDCPAFRFFRARVNGIADANIAISEMPRNGPRVMTRAENLAELADRHDKLIDLFVISEKESADDRLAKRCY